MSYEEALRRMLVAMARRAGTLIRKEELRRQALTASINRPIAEALLKEIEEFLKSVPDFEEALKSSVKKAMEEKKPLLDTVISDAIKSLIEAFPLALSGSIDRMKDALTRVNEQINTTNSIIDDLSKEGIHLPKIEPILLDEKKKENIIYLSIALKEAKRRLRIVVDFLRELEKYGEETNVL